MKNVGGSAFPFDIKVTYIDDTSGIFHQTPIVCKRNQKQINVFVKTKKAIKSAVLDGGIFMDADESNNKWCAK